MKDQPAKDQPTDLRSFERQVIALLDAIARMEEAQRHFEREILGAFREVGHEVSAQSQLLLKIAGQLLPLLTSIKIQFNAAPTATGDKAMQIGPVILTSAGQATTASVVGFDQNGQPMPSDFKMPTASFTIDDTSGAVVTSTDNGDGTDTVTAVANGVVNLTASLTSAEGLSLSDTETVTVAIPIVPPPTPELSSIKVAFA